MPLFDTSKCLPLLHSNRNGSIRWWAVVTANAIYLPMSFKTLEKNIGKLSGFDVHYKRDGLADCTKQRSSRQHSKDVKCKLRFSLS